MKSVWAFAAVLTAGAGVVFADTVVEAGRKAPHRDARVTAIADGKLVFTAAGRETKVDLAKITTIEVGGQSALNEAEKFAAENEARAAEAAKKYEAIVNTPGPPWRGLFVRYRLVVLYSKLGEIEPFAKHFVEMFKINPKEAEALFAGLTVPQAGDAAAKKAGDLVNTAINDAIRRRINAEVLLTLKKRIGGEVPVAKTDTKSPAGTDKKDTPTKVNPGGTPDLTVTIQTADKSYIDRVASLQGGGKFAEAAELFMKAELDVDAGVEASEKYLLNGGMACIKAAEEVQKDIDKLKAEMFRQMGEAQEKLRQQVAAKEPVRIRYLTYGAIALTRALDLPDSDDKRFAEAAYWAGWAHEQLNRPLRARVLYGFFLDTFERSAPEEFVKKGRAAVERLSRAG
jgi:hypothetical protein